ncbi:hypothetical protein Ssi03_53750 [Sphaerisporangium siamense]|uniref:Phospholipid carrier-dependent glycosyltransferase n=1 Tax=Sphaerisporangium siamense TaxID=795645 RepID=A0A7W7D6S6_9ACTN|nr:hypothetical protein [Sphaerisporangium siamense]MBB4701247.1 hypothetical protein [Sphaerisporangium siamense]GII87385.1 hypothetical protein Ssi03_53750 [Sphaerisporangium siamense]
MLTDIPTPAPPRPRSPWLAALADHRLFAVVVALAAGLRVVTMLGFRPARTYWYDSFTYLDTAVHLAPNGAFHPVGYSLLLRVLWPFHDVNVIAAVQHGLGLAMGVMIYAVLRRRGLPAWGAAAATVPVLFDASFLQLEQAILSDTLFMFLIVAGLTTLLWSPRLSARAAAGAGLLFAAAAVTRTIAVPLIVLVLVVLALRRVGARRLLAVAVAGLLPVAAYAGWYAAHHGRFALNEADGVALWARTMTFADCSVIKPPPREAVLCPNGTVVDAASEYVWAAGASLNRLPGGRFAHNDLARSFAVKAILAQPFDYLRDVARDTAIAFSWTPIAHPKRTTPAFGWANGVGGLPAQPLIDKVRREYDPGIRGVSSVSPYSDFLIAYQYPAYLRGPMLAAILLAGAAGVLRRRRAALLPWSVAVALLVGPVAVLDFDHRYVMPVVPVACLAAALALRPRSD